MNVRAAVFATACALALGAAATPAQAETAPAASCDFNSIKDKTVEQVTEMMPPSLRDQTRNDVIYSILKNQQIKELPLYYRDKIQEACH
ncbi:hypothetical protein [Actinomadura oligospora]|uniref:hypothetical protein n=1 Tax=Actinomadura oligospora TaxID=111804 RepID=UPI00047C1742|nr:hypothetical protein [Actinomadura oligospora]